MGYRTIVVILDSTRNVQRVSDFAIALAKSQKAHLIGLHAEIVPSVPVVAPMEVPDPVTIQALQDMAHGETREIAKGFESRAALEGITYEWRAFVTTAGYSASAILETLRSADLIIAGQPDPSAPGNSRSDLEEILLDAGRPIMVVPYVYGAPAPLDRVLIAWNGSRESARAVFDALPLLIAAREVEVLTASPATPPSEAQPVPAAEIAATLARHGVKVTVINEEKGDLSNATIIENRLSDDSIDLLVMGAFSHSRLWQTLFGGVTRTVLESMSSITLLSR